MKFRYTEIFYSVQGEGKFVGVPSVFLRMFGCNFTCQGFGMPKGELSTEYLNVNPNDYHDLEELPLVKTGCDSYASWDNRAKHLTTDTDVDGLVDALLATTPHGRWTEPNGQDVHLVITGGEPLLGWQRLWPDLLSHPKMEDLKNVTFETNTTQLLRDNFASYIGSQNRFTVTFSCSPKLSVSGELWSNAIKPEVAVGGMSISQSFIATSNSIMYFKFVVADEMDVQEVDDAVAEFRNAGIEVPVFCMPVGGCETEYMENRSKVAEVALSKGYRYSPRLHVDLFGNAWST